MNPNLYAIIDTNGRHLSFVAIVGQVSDRIGADALLDDLQKAPYFLGHRRYKVNCLRNASHAQGLHQRRGLKTLQ